MRILFMTIAIALFAATSANAAQTNYKKDYCDKQEYYTNSGANDGSTYPHLHCAKRWITYSKSSSKHYNFAAGNGVSKGTANSACTAADGQSASNLKAIIKEICHDDGETCSDCD